MKIRYKNKDYQTSDFDHGYPPIEIEKVVNKIVSEYSELFNDLKESVKEEEYVVANVSEYHLNDIKQANLKIKENLQQKIHQSHPA